MIPSFKEKGKKTYTLTSIGAPKDGKLPMDTLLFNICHKLTRRANAIMLDILDGYSSECDLPRISKEVHKGEGLAGLINISKFFLEKVAEHFTKCMEEFNNETSA